MKAERIPTQERLLLEVCELLVAATVLQAVEESAGYRALVFRLRSSVCFFYAYYGPKPLCRFANYLMAADAVMADFSWLQQSAEQDEPEEAIVYYRNTLGLEVE